MPDNEKAIRSSILKLALPAVAEMMLHMSAWMVDTALVGRLGSSQLAAVALGGQIYFMIIFALGGIGVGATALVARYTGAKEPENASRAGGQAILMAFGLGTIGLFVVRFFAPWFAQYSGMPAEVISYVKVYTGAMSFGAPLQISILAAGGVLRGRGDTRSPLYTTALMNIVSIIAEYVLIFGAGPFPRLEVLGAGIAPVIGGSVGFLLGMFIVLGGAGTAGTTVRHIFTYSGDDVRRLLKLSIPAALESILMDGGRTVTLGFAGVLGAQAIAAHQVTATAESFSFMPGYGFAVAATVMAGQAVGARQPELARRTTIEAWKIAASVMGLAGLSFILLPRVYLGIFTDDPVVIGLGAVCLGIVGAGEWLVATTEVFTGALRGAGDTRAAMVITLLGTWGIRVPLTYILIRRFGMGLPAAWAVMVLDWSVRSLLAFLWFRAGRWQRVKI